MWKPFFFALQFWSYGASLNDGQNRPGTFKKCYKKRKTTSIQPVKKQGEGKKKKKHLKSTSLCVTSAALLFLPRDTLAISLSAISFAFRIATSFLSCRRVWANPKDSENCRGFYLFVSCWFYVFLPWWYMSFSMAVSRSNVQDISRVACFCSWQSCRVDLVAVFSRVSVAWFCVMATRSAGPDRGAFKKLSSQSILLNPGPAPAISSAQNLSLPNEVFLLRNFPKPALLSAFLLLCILELFLCFLPPENAIQASLMLTPLFQTPSLFVQVQW